MKGYFIPDYPSVVSLKSKAKRRIPSFAFEYLDGGCNEELNLRKNTDEIRTIELEPRYIAEKTIDSGDGTNRL